VALERYALSTWRSHFHMNFSFQHAHDVATLLSAQQAHFKMAAIFQQHFKMHFNISFACCSCAFDDAAVHHCAFYITLFASSSIIAMHRFSLILKHLLHLHAITCTSFFAHVLLLFTIILTMLFIACCIRSFVFFP
jgi:hypothetical protein